MILSIEQIPLAGKKVLIRVDFNVPMKGKVITNDARMRAAIPTIQMALDRCASNVILMSHLGRPEEGVFDSNLSLAPVAEHLAQLMGRSVRLVSDLETMDLVPGEVVMLENVRFNEGEKEDDKTLSAKYAALADVFVMDAFGTAHREEASTHGVAEFAKIACGGLLLIQEIEALQKVLSQPARPLLAIVGGSKVSTKLEVLSALAHQVDSLIVGGGIANTFLAASGFKVGKSLMEPELMPLARKIIENIQGRGGKVPLPVDVVTAKTFDEFADPETKRIEDVQDDDLILDVGPETREKFGQLILSAGTILWNGPIGVFEFESFRAGTHALALAIAASEAYSLAGGGDTIAAIELFRIQDRLSYISTGGGAFLEFIEGKKLPAIEMLLARAREAK